MARFLQLALRAIDSVALKLGRANPERIAEHQSTGAAGEELAFFHLQEKGYTIVARNWRTPRKHGEIDLIGWDGDMLCFVEVKTRSTRAVKPAEAAVDYEKRRTLSAVARDYMRRMPSRPSYRFDIVSVYCEVDAAPEITLFKNAFPMT